MTTIRFGRSLAIIYKFNVKRRVVGMVGVGEVARASRARKTGRRRNDNGETEKDLTDSVVGAPSFDL